MEKGLKEGEKNGKAEGLKEGEKKGKEETAKKMLEAGSFTDDIIAQMTVLDLSDIEQLKE